WSQQAYVKASNSGAGDAFGRSVALSGDGNTLAVAAEDEGSNATGINGDMSDNSASSAGAVYVFTRNGSTWSQQAYVKSREAQVN
ncbi:alpha beta-propellor repeat-containing integrin, partial [Acidovorax sp. NO-1]|uniref:FG-GAP repeat protein n=1 Tax=Acidovorax sp. NO-1 TaxID=512030 RepID=UPI00023FC84B